jgi:hypothetical protein
MKIVLSIQKCKSTKPFENANRKNPNDAMIGKSSNPFKNENRPNHSKMQTVKIRKCNS